MTYAPYKPATTKSSSTLNWSATSSATKGVTVTTTATAAIKPAAVAAKTNVSTKSQVITPLPSPSTPSSTAAKTQASSSSSDNNGSRSTSQVLKPIHFEVSCTGLKPLTAHKFYYEGIDVTEYCTQVFATGQTWNTQLTTDRSGSISFVFNYSADLEAVVDGLNNTQYALAGDKKFELKAVGSAASKIVPFKN